MRLTRSRRWLAALVTLSYAWGYLLLFAHYAAERHSECLEHGTEHHVVEGDRHDPTPSEGLNALGDIEDDHCSLGEIVRNTPSFSTPTAVHALLEQVELPHFVVPPDLAPASYGAVWRYAPKTSPPMLLS